MCRIQLVKGKDRPKLGNGMWAFPTTWENKGYTKTVELLLDMTAPIHRKGKVVTGDSGFCVAESAMALHEKGVYGQFLIKKGGTGRSMSRGTSLMPTGEAPR